MFLIKQWRPDIITLLLYIVHGIAHSEAMKGHKAMILGTHDIINIFLTFNVLHKN